MKVTWSFLRTGIAPAWFLATCSGLILAHLFYFQATMVDIPLTEVTQVKSATDAKKQEQTFTPPTYEDADNQNTFLTIRQSWKRADYGTVKKLTEPIREKFKEANHFYWLSKSSQSILKKNPSMARYFAEQAWEVNFNRIDVNKVLDRVENLELSLTERASGESETQNQESSTPSPEEMIFKGLKSGNISMLPVVHRYGKLASQYPAILYVEIGIFLLSFIALFFYCIPTLRCLIAKNPKENPELQKKGEERFLSMDHFAFLLSWFTGIALCGSHLYFERLYAGILPLGSFIPIALAWLCFSLICSLIITNRLQAMRYSLGKQIIPPEEATAAKSGKDFKQRTRMLLAFAVLTVVPLSFMAVQLVTEPTIQEFVHSVFHGNLSSQFVYDIIPILRLTITAFFIVFFLFLGWSTRAGLADAVIHPLERIIHNMSEVKKGDLEVRCSVYSNNEIGQLYAHFNSMVKGLGEIDNLQSSMSKYLSREITETVLDAQELGGQELEASVLFSDIRSFTAMSETMEPGEVIEFLNEYFGFVVTAITREGGVINKFIGDCVMALFGVPNQSPYHADQALRAALAMRKKVREYNIIRERRGDSPVHIGIGIHSGKLVAGNMGTPDRMEYTVIGDTVNVASRIESQTKELKTDLLISQACLERLSGKIEQRLLFDRCPGIMVKGKSEPLVLHKVRPKPMKKPEPPTPVPANQ
jgi:class 3 adenylate cyclase